MLSVAAAQVRALQVLAGNTQLVFGQCSKNAEEEAEWLISFLADGHGQVSAAALDEALQRRVRNREPMAHVTGFATLCGLTFKTDRRALVPRSYIAELLENWPADVKSQTCLDLCCGNGNLAIAAALRIPSLRSCVATDVSSEALELARENVALHKVDEKVSLLQSDMFARVEGRAFDLILCNPPYVRRSAMAKLPEEFRHEPEVALAGGSDGFDFVRTVLCESNRFLTSRGHLILEVGWGQKAALKREFPHVDFEFAETSAGEGPVVVVQKKT